MDTEIENSSSKGVLEEEIKTYISDFKILTENEILNTGYVQRIKENLLPKIISNISEENFSKSIQQLQEDAFINISNRFYETAGLNNGNLKTKNRFLEGMEFQELGLNEMANHTFLKNIQESQRSESSIIDYAIYNLRNGNSIKSNECLQFVLENNPQSCLGNLIMAYIYFQNKKIIECESTLQVLTKESPEFFEAWIALYLVCMSEMKNDLAEEILLNLSDLKKGALKLRIHELEELSWNCHQENEDIFLNSTKFFIKTGCFEFAEHSLIKFYLKSGLNSNAYQFYVAVIDYLRGNFKNALHHLNKICLKTEDVTKLKGHILYKLKEFDLASEEFKLIKNYDYLVYLRFGTHLNSNEEFEKGKKYFWECCNRNSSYSSWMGLGESYFKLDDLKCAEKCFIKANLKCRNSVEPFYYLAEIYERWNYNPQHKLCLEALKN